MVVYRCDGCGRELDKRSLRYKVSIDVRAAYDKMEVGLAELVRDHRAELEELIERLKEVEPRKIEETVYKGLELDLCPECQKRFIKNPLRFNPDSAADDPALDVDSFLRSLGYGDTQD